MEQEFVKGLFSGNASSLFILASGQVFALIILGMIYKTGQKLISYFLESLRRQEETLKRIVETLSEIRRDTEEIKEVTRDNNINLHVLKDKASAPRRRTPKAS